MTQREAVRKYLETHGSITRRQAAVHLGIYELASRIGELEDEGWEIPRSRKTVKTRYGKTGITIYKRPKDRCRAYRVS